MVKPILSLSRTGLQDWLLQRISALILLAYIIFLTIYFYSTPKLNFYLWQQLFSNIYMKIFTLLAIVSLIVHAWIGMWIILTDYIKITWLRMLIQTSINLGFIASFVWSIIILWP